MEVLSFGLTKLGAAVGEAVIFFDRTLAEEFDYRCKAAGHLASKMRFLSAAWCGLLRDRAWERVARGANERAQVLRRELVKLPGVEPLYPTEANAVFLRLPAGVPEAMQGKGWHFYELAGIGDWRLMCSWATREEDMKAFGSDLRAALEAEPS